MKKYTNKKFTGVVIILVLTLTISCNKDWLEPQPLSFFSPENTLTNEAGFKAALAACANNMRLEYYEDGAPIITEHIFSEVAVEGTTDKFGPAVNMNQLITPDANLNSIDFNRIGWFWEREWLGIRLANTIISRLPDADFSASAKKVIQSKAYFYRALYYYRLLNQFGDIPTSFKELQEPKLDFQTVQREVVLQRIKGELDTAAVYVPWVSDKGDVNKGAVYHLLTKVNLSLGLFDEAITSATAVIGSGTFKLVQNRFGSELSDVKKNVIWDLHRPLNKYVSANTEALFIVTDRFGDQNASLGTTSMRQAVPFFSVNSILTPDGKGPAMSNVANTATSPNAIEIDLVTPFGRGIGRCRGTSYSTRMIWDDANDLRHDTTSGNWMEMNMLVYNNPAVKATPYYGKRLQIFSNTGALTVSTGDTIRTWYPWPHYKLYVADQIRSPMQGGNSDWYVFRLAETYLLRAEAYWWKGDAAKAADDVNAVRTRAKCAPYLPAQVDLGTILDERARELYYEEPRKTELTRIAFIFAKTGKSFNGKTYSTTTFNTANFWYDRLMDKNEFYKKNIKNVRGDAYTISPYHVLWPIPRSAIQANSNGQINQNLGYSGSETNQPPLTQIPD
jgi:starch-binding outer membrane protein, SusD/RagB family